MSNNASNAEIRRAYLHLARRHHPDVRSSKARPDGSVPERDMRRINEAWAVLGDDGLRARYDADLRANVSRPIRKPSRPAGTSSPDFVPFDPSNGADDAELLDDTPIPGTEVPRWLQMLGPGLLVAAIASFSVGLVTSINLLTTLAAVSFILALLSFVATPFVAVYQSARAERE
ncbi:MAG: DnaJ domain-containing protein [Actinobacteria bacterium]|nr:DnaJ domain-containing protein [Actinomycetota bacterium]